MGLGCVTKIRSKDGCADPSDSGHQATNRSAATVSAVRSPRLGASAPVLLGAGLAAAAVAGGLYVVGTQHTPALWYFNDFRLPPL